MSPDVSLPVVSVVMATVVLMSLVAGSIVVAGMVVTPVVASVSPSVALGLTGHAVSTTIASNDAQGV
jgi:hypothetical protein